ncbi:MAG TPA: Flp pilus assembly protein CpaB [Acidimicrobiia bacterium]|nr:Flp pilus assembly protein CpaB [Acidimicrobiia bacterium]
MGRRAIVLLVALILAGLAAWAVWNYLQGIENEVTAGQAQVKVFRAVDNIAEGTDGSIIVSDFNSGGQLIEEGIEEQEDLPDGAITTPEQLNQVLGGAVAAGPISANTVLVESQWTVITIDVTPLSQQIPEGKQAMVISTDNVRGVNGFVNPGDRINLIITLDIAFELLPPGFEGINVNPAEAPPEGQAATDAASAVVTYTRFVLQGIPVLATGRDVAPDENAPEQVQAEPTEPVEGTTDTTVPAEDTGNETIFTLEVTPEQAERIAYSFENGSMWLTLVPEDFVEVETQGVIIDTLFGGDLVADIFG